MPALTRPERYLCRVSIRAPRFREAMPTWIYGIKARYGFQSAPPVSGRRCRWRLLYSTPSGIFQSAPPVSGRRCRLIFRLPRLHGIFNPRPPFPGGDAPSPATTESRGTKSPHCANLKIPGQKISYENHYHPETPCRSEVIATRESPWKCLITWGSRNFTESTEHQNQLHENSHVLGPRNP